MSLLDSILEQFEINQSLFVVLILFVATYIIMSHLCLNRLSAGLVERDHRIEGREEKAVDLKRELVDIQANLKSQMKKARLDANDTFLKLKGKAVTEQREILTAAREHAAGEIKNARQQVNSKLEVERKRLESEVPELAKLIVEQILGGRSKSKGGFSVAATDA